MTATRVLLAPDKFKGTLTAAQVAGHLATGLRSVRPDVEVTVVPVADGGDGTIAAARAAGFALVPVQASGPTGTAVSSGYAVRAAEGGKTDDGQTGGGTAGGTTGGTPGGTTGGTPGGTTGGTPGGTAVVELADVSGLALLPQGGLAPLTSSSRGTGEVIAAALSAGCTTVVVGIGGSASTDGGAGLLSALGARILAADGSPVADGGAALADAASVDLSGLHPGLAHADIVVASDVDNPLTGPRGAAAVYGPQKGATADQVSRLDAALSHWADLVHAATGRDHRDEPGAGAAGGVGFGLLAVLGAHLRPGAELVFELTGLREALAGADLVVTGEGALDLQTLHGKAPAAVATAAREAAVPVVAVAGQISLDAQTVAAAGFSRAYALLDEGTREQAMTDPGPLLERIGARIATDVLGGGPSVAPCTDPDGGGR